ncbi:FeoA family protein [Nostoc carneum NIES-2107]|nr:FeoA family protein [Nostoc carneum NIES-2107]
MSKTHLAALQPGQIATILHLQSEPGLHQRLLALGFRTGRQVEMIRHGWLSGPLHVRIGTTEVMLRRREAQEVGITDVCTGAAQ